MTDKIYITNRTDKPLLATISENGTGHNVITCQLQPGANELNIKDLSQGVYMVNLEDDAHDIFYRQQVTKN